MAETTEQKLSSNALDELLDYGTGKPTPYTKEILIVETTKEKLERFNNTGAVALSGYAVLSLANELAARLKVCEEALRDADFNYRYANEGKEITQDYSTPYRKALRAADLTREFKP